MSKGCDNCERDAVAVTLVDGTALCANCAFDVALEWHQGAMHPPTPTKGKTCAACGSGEVVGTLHDFSLYADEQSLPKDVNWDACATCLKDTSMMRLTPEKVKRLKASLGETFLTHDDFYDEEGNAVQPA